MTEFMQLLAGKDQVLPHESPSPESTSYNAQVNRQVCYSENNPEHFFWYAYFKYHRWKLYGAMTSMEEIVLIQKK